MVLELKANEVVVKASDSSLLENDKKISGKLILTNQRVYFKDEKKSEEPEALEILPAEIRELFYFNTFKIFPNGLHIIMKNGKEHKFKVTKRNSWGQAINAMY
ncbi:MAG: hypothetical protein ACQESW_12285 [Bacteroidota bacterium]